MNQSFYVPKDKAKDFMIKLTGIQQFYKLESESKAIEFAVDYVVRYSPMNEDVDLEPEYITIPRKQYVELMAKIVGEVVTSILKKTDPSDVVAEAEKIIKEKFENE